MRERNAFVVVDRARHAGRPQQLVVQVPVDELMDVAQILQQFPGLAERRGDQLDQRFGKIGGDVLVGERRAQRGRVRSLLRFRPRATRAATPSRRPCGRRAAPPRAPELMRPASRRSNFLSTMLRITPGITHHKLPVCKIGETRRLDIPGVPPPQCGSRRCGPCRCTNSARARNARSIFGKSWRRATLTSHCGTQKPGRQFHLVVGQWCNRRRSAGSTSP